MLAEVLGPCPHPSTSCLNYYVRARGGVVEAGAFFYPAPALINICRPFPAFQYCTLKSGRAIENHVGLCGLRYVTHVILDTRPSRFLSVQH